MKPLSSTHYKSSSVKSSGYILLFGTILVNVYMLGQILQFLRHREWDGLFIAFLGSALTIGLLVIYSTVISEATVSNGRIKVAGSFTKFEIPISKIEKVNIKANKLVRLTSRFGWNVYHEAGEIHIEGRPMSIKVMAPGDFGPVDGIKFLEDLSSILESYQDD